MNNTKDTEDMTAYYLKVVDCQQACPAHTPVPEYIRLIAEGKYTESYMLNRSSNVFPGILGRVCDRPCEPACRRGRVDDDPVAICRLKRVASDYKDDIKHLLPQIPKTKNGKKIALIGAGPASLTVANDLMPLGYEVDLYEKDNKAGGAMLSQVPGFRLPMEVLEEETQNILDFGVTSFFNKEVKSLKTLFHEKNYDAVFVGTGAPVAKDLNLKGRKEFDKEIHLGLNFLSNVHFGHKKTIGKTTVVIGGGNTAMDCCRTALRLGATKVYVIAPEPFEKMFASHWEKEDALEEGVTFLNLLLPDEFLGDAHLDGISFKQLESCYNEKGQWDPKEIADQKKKIIPCDEVILAIGQTTSFPFIEEELGALKKDANGRLVANVDPTTYQSSNKKIFFGGDCSKGPKNIIWAVRQGHDAAQSIHLFCQELDPLTDRKPYEMTLESQKMGFNQFSYDNGFDGDARFKVPTKPLKDRFHNLTTEVEIGFDLKTAIKESKRCLNCDVQTVFKGAACIECDSCIDICPSSCLSFASKDPVTEVFKEKVPQTNRWMIKDEDICIHCGLCSERCPTGAWDMKKFTLNTRRNFE